MSTSKILRPGDLTAYERWELPLVGEEESEEDHTPNQDTERNEKAAEANLGQPTLETQEQTETSTSSPLTVEQLEALQKQAYEEGFNVGLREGRKAAQKELEQKVARLEALMATLSEPLRELDEAVEEELLQLGIAIARQLIRRELKTQPSEVVAAVREGLHYLPSHSRHVRLRLHPDDVGVVRSALSLSGEERRWQVVEDPSLSRGGCQLETEHSRIDATVEARLNAAIARVLGGERKDDQGRD
ncbi:flagellar assembly protein FliH [Nitrosococcus wardiae]|uniref:Flagellar assembly protein FliH n=1 Tax=Nitrosococcus wardiae TaxID=1814290 RepID=A0A4P7BZI1_9GAMM|nr:flagellar assembly protein FliH [Nitrosococcus wardiae]QBQ54624.1 flagellar assembly protein FliH [Nitrosococcus wardiae]